MAKSTRKFRNSLFGAASLTPIVLIFPAQAAPLPTEAVAMSVDNTGGFESKEADAEEPVDPKADEEDVDETGQPVINQLNLPSRGEYLTGAFEAIAPISSMNEGRGRPSRAYLSSNSNALGLQ